MSLPNNYCPLGGNQFYKHVQAHGTAGPFEPGFIQMSGESSNESKGAPFRVLDVNVDLSAGGSANDVIALSTNGIPYGCFVTQVSYNSGNSLPAAVGLSVGYASADPAPADPSVPVFANFNTFGVAPPTVAAPAPPGGDPNGGHTVPIPTGVTVPQPAGPSPDDQRQQFPVLVLTTNLAPTAGAFVNLKVIYSCP